MMHSREVTSEKVLFWARRVETQRSKKGMLATILETEEFHMIKHVKMPMVSKT